MHSVTGDGAAREEEAHGTLDGDEVVGDEVDGAFDAFDARPQPLTSPRERRRALRVGTILVVTLAGAGALAALSGPGRASPSSGLASGDDARTVGAPAGVTVPSGEAAQTRRPSAIADPALDRRQAVRLFRFQTPAGRLVSTTGTGGAAIATPGCEVTIQLAGGQPRRLRECSTRAWLATGWPFVIGPLEPLRFEVPGWHALTEDGATMLGPGRAGTWTIEIPACVTRSGDWLCTTWYAVVEVRA